jgi:hypothetical protein
MTLPAVFGSSWESFVDVWCLGSPPALLKRDTVERALNALHRLWPEEVERITSPLRPGLGVAHGKWVVDQAVGRGLVLLHCESLIGFGDVLKQMKSDREQAYTHYSVLLFAVNLLNAGYCPELEPTRGNKKPDARITTEAGEVYFEVVAPRTSLVMQTTWGELSELAGRLAADNPGRRVYVFLHRDLDKDLTDRIVESVKGRPCADQPFQLGTDALISVRLMSQDDASLVPSGNTDPAILTAACAFSHAHAIVAIPKADERAERLLNDESAHFSKDDMNVLAANLTRVPGGMSSWPELVEQCFRKRGRFGAAVLFTESSMATGEIRCRCLQNPAAYNQVPQTLINALARLDTKTGALG